LLIHQFWLFKANIDKNMANRTELLREIKDKIIKANNSPLYGHRTKNKYFPVIGEGSHDAKIMFIGEAP